MRILCISYTGVILREICKDHQFELIEYASIEIRADEIEKIVSSIEDIEKVDCIICEYMSSVPILFRLKTRGYNGPIIWIPHSNPWGLLYLLYTLLLAQCFGRQDIVIAGSQETAQRYTSFFGMRSYYMPTYGIDTSLFFPHDKKISRKRLNLPEGKILLYTGRISSDKNIGALLATFNSLLEKLPDITLVISYSFKSDTYYNRLKEDFQNVHMVGRIGLNELPYLYSASDLFVSCATSYYETFGRSPLESIACGTPVVVPNWNGFKEHINNKVGRLIPVDFLDISIYDPNSYAMVNLTKFIDACVNLLQCPLPRHIRLDENLSLSNTNDRFRSILRNMKKVDVERNEVASCIKTKDSIIDQVVNNLSITSTEDLFQLVTSYHNIPELDPYLQKEVYMRFFSSKS